MTEASSSSSVLRLLPRVDRVLARAELGEAHARLGRALKLVVRGVLEEARREVLAGAPPIDEQEAASRALARANAWTGRRMRHVINGTGVILHTNLGRAPLSAPALAAIAQTAGGYASLELDLDTGVRGGRGAFVEAALRSLTGAAAALVVNNNAAAVLLALASVATGRGVVVSRGELVEIGGGFRVPEVLARSGARLLEVGTTNRTRVSDYARAIDEAPEVAAAILRVHPGNFRQTGFVERPALGELVALARERGVPLIEDLGGGALVDLSACGLCSDPLVRDSVAAGADVVTFSTDKILGGPQGGVLVGGQRVIEKARRDPLARALRMGRLPLVALEATLASYLEGDLEAIPAVAMSRRGNDALFARVEGWVERLTDRMSSARPAVRAEARTSKALAGGGTYAEEEMASWALALLADDPELLASRLRAGTPAVLARVERDVVLIDARTVLDHEDEALLSAIREAWIAVA